MFGKRDNFWKGNFVDFEDMVLKHYRGRGHVCIGNQSNLYLKKAIPFLNLIAIRT